MNKAETKSPSWGRVFLVVLLLCLLVGPNFGPVPAILGARIAIEPAVIGLLISFIIAFVIVIVAMLWLEGDSFATLRARLRELGLGKPARPVANIVGAIVGLAWGGLLMSSILQFQPETNLAEFSVFRLLAAGLAAFGTILEDVVTRGYLMNRMQGLKVPNWAQAILSALVFALYHSIWAFNPFSFVFSVVYGLLLSGLYLWGRRSLTPVILGHALAVLISEPFATMLIFVAPGA